MEEKDVNNNEEENINSDDNSKEEVIKNDNTSNEENTEVNETTSEKTEKENESNETLKSSDEVKEKNEDKKEEGVTEEKTNISEKFSFITKNSSLKKILIIVLAVIVLLIGVRAVFNKFAKNDNISGVKKVLSAKYTSVSCINSSCDGFIVIDGDKLSKYKVYLYNSDGKKIANYKVNYNKDDKTTDVPVSIGSDYYISTTVNVTNLKVSKYSIKNKRGKAVFETSNPLSIINDNLIAMKEKNSYSILNKKGKTIYNNIADIDEYLNGKYIAVKINDTYSILDSKGEKVLTNYSISKVVTDENDKELYAIVKNTVDDVYNYYSFSKGEIIGDSFISYRTGENDYELIITKKENDNNVKYTLSKNGKQTKAKDTDQIAKKIKEQIDTNKYTLYSDSVYDENQKNVLVTNTEEKSVGVLNIKSKDYKAIYAYKQNKTYFYSTVSDIDSNDKNNAILKISCSESSCDEKKTVIYDMKNNKSLYKSEGINVSDYKEYEGGYKVIDFSSDKSNKYGSKNVVFDKNNKELEVSENDITIIDKKLIIGKESSYSMSLYSVKNNKMISNKKVKRVEINDKVVYKYTDSSDNTIILDSNGNEVIKVSDSDYITLNKDHYVYVKDNILYTYNITKEKTYKYKLKDNEKLNAASGSVISPYRNAIFVNNSSDKYIKIINFKGNQIKKIKNLEISSVELNKDNDKAFIIVKKNTNEGSLYGLYVAE